MAIEIGRVSTKDLTSNSYKSLGFNFAGEKMPGSKEGKFFQHMVRDFSK